MTALYLFAFLLLFVPLVWAAPYSEPRDLDT